MKRKGITRVVAKHAMAKECEMSRGASRAIYQVRIHVVKIQSDEGRLQLFSATTRKD